jgi:predicted GNAT superfamily acetyltransferase
LLFEASIAAFAAPGPMLRLEQAWRPACCGNDQGTFAMKDTSSPLPIDSVSLAEERKILALNNEHAAELSWLEPEQLSYLLGQSFYARRIGEVEAFIMTFDQDANYDSPNFLWFRTRYPRFVYVDRVVVAKSARGRGHARRLYDALFEQAKQAGQTIVTCEVNAEPPNPASDAFHAALGFAEVGDAVIHGGEKSVRYFLREIAA